MLYLIEILHQTTTIKEVYIAKSALYLIEILHQTTTAALVATTSAGCILLKFYIKPQPRSFSALIICMLCDLCAQK